MIDGIFNSSSHLGEIKCVVPHEKGVISCGSRGFIFKDSRGNQYAMTYDKLSQWLYNQSKIKDIQEHINPINNI